MNSDPSGMGIVSVIQAEIELMNFAVLQAVKNIRNQFAISVAAGGRALWALGKTVEIQVYRVLNMMEGAVVNQGAQLFGSGGRRVIDFMIKYAERIAYVEVKYKLPTKAGSALTRLHNQMLTAVENCAARNCQTVLFTFVEPSADDMLFIYEKLGPELSMGIQYVYGFQGLAQWLRLYFY